jgi:hypothetical protein
MQAGDLQLAVTNRTFTKRCFHDLLQVIGDQDIDFPGEYRLLSFKPVWMSKSPILAARGS